MKKLPVSRNPWPYAIITYFAVFVSAMTAFVVWAVKQNMDLVQKDYYEEEIRFQQQLNRLNRTHPLRREIDVVYQASQGSVTITLPAAHAQQTVTGGISFYRPSDASLDQDMPLSVTGEGKQTVDVRKLRAGLWKVRLRWRADGQEYFFDKSVVLAGSRP